MDRKIRLIDGIVIIFLMLFILLYVTLNSVYSNPIACAKSTAVCLENTFLFDAYGDYEGEPRKKIIEKRIQRIADDKTLKINDLRARETKKFIIIEHPNIEDSNEKVIITENIKLDSDSSVKKNLYLQVIKAALKDYRNQENTLSKFLNFLVLAKNNSIVNFAVILILGAIFIRFSKLPNVVAKMAELSNKMVIAGLELKNLFKNDDPSISLYRSIAPFIFLIILGYLYIIIYSLSFLNLNSFLDFSLDSLSIFSNISIVATSMLLLGGLTGFFFGVPRIEQGNKSIEQENEKKSGGDVLFNTNLVQISDWLTKILVGVGLTQIRPILGFLYDSFIKEIAPGFTSNQVTDSSISISMAIGVVIYYSGCGFFMGYIWGNMYYTPSIRNIVLKDIFQKVKKIGEEQDKILTIRRILDLIPFVDIPNVEYGHILSENEAKKIYQDLSNKANVLLSELNKKTPNFPQSLDELFEEVSKDIKESSRRFVFLRPRDYSNFARLLMFKKTDQAYKLALIFLNEAIKSNPYEYDYYKTKGSLLKVMGSYSDSIEAFEKAKKLNPYEPKIYSSLGAAKLALYLSKKKDLDDDKKVTILYEILQLFNKSINLDPYNPLFYTNRGITYSELARYEDAQNDYEKAININDDFSFAWYNMACYYAIPKLRKNVPDGESKRAINCLRKAIKKTTFWKSQAAKDDDFDSIRNDPEFQSLIS